MTSSESLAEFTRLVSELEQATKTDQAHAQAKSLTWRIVATDYATAEERYAAQALVIRLSRFGRVITTDPEIASTPDDP